MSTHTATDMRWNKEKRVNDDVMRHSADGEAWKEFDGHSPSLLLIPEMLDWDLPLTDSIHMGFCSPVFAFTPGMEGEVPHWLGDHLLVNKSAFFGVFMFTSRFVRPLNGQNCSFFSLKGTEVAIRGFDGLEIALRALFCLSRTLHGFAEVSTFVKTQTLLVLAFAEPNL
ncbi:hypothetical protein L3X38_003590 [Prunus dulcis]|uniref:Uncharacterized protein n=1 Tax=Prunus dulcis TaxID=3755 RepID=A0AAD4ZM97_PRUDU|nr:hypothetical protein L3X38_003590 [Prunus dulcis]